MLFRSIDEQRQDFEPTIWNQKPGVDLKQVWFAGVHADIGASYPPDKDTGFRASDTPLKWMLDEATTAGLILESHITNSLTDGVQANIHKSRNHVYRLKSPLHRPLIIADKPTLIHPSVKDRYLADSSYRPFNLKNMVERVGWDNIQFTT